MKKKIQMLLALYSLFSLNIYAQDTTQNKTVKTSFYQVSFIHPVGTNGRFSGAISNKLSFNILSGYTGGLDGFELSLFSGVDKGPVKGCQIAGFSNVNLGSVNGSQIGCFSNVNLGSTKGLQIAGFLNLDADSVEGIQISGFSNIIKGNAKGAQISGFCNVVNGNANGAQISGFANVVTGDSKGMQISGFANVAAGVSEDAQISGFINAARVNKGLQLGFINVADSSTGVSIGFMSIVRHGYFNLSLYTDEMLMANLSYKMGTHQFYNIWGVSANKEMWGLTYGLGKLFRSDKKVSINIDLTATNMNYKKIFEIQTCMKTKIESDLNIRLNNSFNLFAGLSYNVFVSDKILDEDLQNYVRNITKSDIQTTTFKSIRMFFWPGLSIGLKWEL